MTVETEIDILARTIYGEARGEGVRGMHAVANVIMNRFMKAIEGEIRWWGDDVIDICKKPKQFSCWNANDPNAKKIKEVTVADSRFAEALATAGLAVDGTLEDITNGATSYYADSIKPPYWAKDKDPVAHIGHHLFFRDES